MRIASWTSHSRIYPTSIDITWSMIHRNLHAMNWFLDPIVSGVIITQSRIMKNVAKQSMYVVDRFKAQIVPSINATHSIPCPPSCVSYGVSMSYCEHVTCISSQRKHRSQSSLRKDFITFTSSLTRNNRKWRYLFIFKKKLKWMNKNQTIFNSLWTSNNIWQHSSGSTLAQIMTCCLTAPSHYLNQCWLLISDVL